MVQRRNRGGGGSGAWSNWGGWGSGLGWGGGVYDPIWYSDLYPYYLAPLGYGAWGRGYSPYLYNYGTNPFFRISDVDISAAREAPRAVNGLGYTRVAERSATGRGATARGGNTSSGGVSRPRSGSSGGRVTTGGYTRGGGGGGG
ncbi:MAG: hypothetical protein F4Y45_14295, partial [Acidobacteria bacterium]|nr:hypothetical protein [Acidobacteriota bacterium]